MITVTNRILVKKGFGAKLAPAFTSGKELLNYEGFNKVEVNVCVENEEHDEMNVMMYWDAIENYEAWRYSEDFRNAHKRDGNSEFSPVLSNKVVISEIAAVLSK